MPFPSQPVERPAELARAALPDHLPQQRRLVRVVRGTVNQHDAMVGRQTPPELARGHQPAGAATEDDRAASGGECPSGCSLLAAAGRSYICWIAIAKPDSSNSFSEKTTLPSGPTRTLHGTQPFVKARNNVPSPSEITGNSSPYSSFQA